MVIIQGLCCGFGDRLIAVCTVTGEGKRGELGGETWELLS